METLNWRDVDEIRLHDAVIRKPNDQSREVDYLQQVRVALDGAMVHIDTRPTNEPSRGVTDEEVTIHVVPATAVKVIRYRQKPSSTPSMRWV